MTTPTTIEELLDYWPGNIPFKGRLVSEDGSCMCAQGQALHFIGGLTVEELRNVNQVEADRRVAELFGISLTHSVLLRIINDKQEGAPSSVIRNPEQILGGQAQLVLAFWRHLDRMTPAAWEAAKEVAMRADREAAMAAARSAAGAREAAREAAGGAAMSAAWETAMSAAMRAAGGAAKETTWKAAMRAAGASNEIQGAAVMRKRNQPFFFLPLFGFANPEAVVKVSKA
jgi:hypothetical protein